jgi:16S rRNA (cytosine967-C5)-methyltransferase
MREVALDALWRARQGKCTVAEALEEWIRREAPGKEAIRTAYEMALGSARHWMLCEALARACTRDGRIALGGKERALLVLAIYQLHTMNRPDYAVVHSTVQMAKSHSRAFLNAVLRNYCRTRPSPNRFDSYPDVFVQRCFKEYPEQAAGILEAMNCVPSLTVRLRGCANQRDPLWQGQKVLQEQPWRVLEWNGSVEQLAARSDCSIQNITQIQLFQELSQRLPKPPRRILDMCAAPGGKTLLLADTYPEAQIWANDISPKRVERLRANLQKYGIPAQVSCCAAAELQTEEPFDLILVDAPCSNSGVLHKRPEARWRLDRFDALVETQQELLRHAQRLLAPGGSIWYMTCSILACENQPHPQPHFQQQILPNPEGWDGGYCAWLR